MSLQAACVLACALHAPGVRAMARRPPRDDQGAQQRREGQVNDASELSAKELNPASWKGASCGVGQAQTLRVESARDWEKLWKEAFNRPAPAVDFGRYFAVAVFLGLRPTGGYSVEFLEPGAQGGSAIIAYRVKNPGPSSFVIQAFTTPYAVQLYRKTRLPVKVEERK